MSNLDQNQVAEDYAQNIILWSDLDNADQLLGSPLTRILNASYLELCKQKKNQVGAKSGDLARLVFAIQDSSADNEDLEDPITSQNMTVDETD